MERRVTGILAFLVPVALIVLTGWWALAGTGPGAGAVIDPAEATDGVESRGHPVSVRPGDLTPGEPEFVSESPGQRREVSELTTGFEVSAVGPGGLPVARASVVLFRGRSVLAHGRTDDLGHWVPDMPQAGVARVLVWPEEFPPAVRDVELEGPVTVEIEAGAAVAGVVTVDGAPPREPLELEVHWGEGGRGPLSRVPPEAFEVLGRRFGVQSVHPVTVGRDGSFRVAGLPPRGSGGVVWTRRTFLEDVVNGSRITSRRPVVFEREIDDPSMVQLAAPTEALELRLIEACRVHGRVLRGPGQVALRRGTASVAWSEGQGHGMGGTRIHGDGTFQFWVRRPVSRRLSLTVSDDSEWGPRWIPLDVEDPMALDVDLGDVLLDPSPGLAVQVRDAWRQPLAGAAVCFEVEDAAAQPWTGGPHLDRAGRVTGPDGGTDVAVSALGSFLRVTKPGYVTARVPRPPEGERSVVVVLERACALRIRLSSPTEDVGEMHLRVRGGPPLFAHTGSAAPEDFGVAEGELDAFAKWRRASSNEVDYEPREDGRFDLSGLMPNTPIRVQAETGGGRLAGTLEVAPLEPGEWRTVELRLEPGRAHLRMRVVDDVGRGIEGARVVLGGEEFTTREGGRLDLPDLLVGPLEISITCAGYQPFRTTETMPRAGLDLRPVLMRL